MAAPRSRFNRYRALPDNPSDPRVTDLSLPLNAPPGAGYGAPDASGSPILTSGDVAGALSQRRYYNRNVSNMLPVQLVANVSTRILPGNDRRSGLLIQNKDAAATLVFSLGNDAGFNGINVGPGASVLFDFTTPCETLYLIASANILVLVLEISRRD